MMLHSKKAILLIASTAAAGLMTALAAISVVTGPAAGEEMHLAKAAEPAICQTATWPYIPRECLQAAGNDTVPHFAYARVEQVKPDRAP